MNIFQTIHKRGVKAVLYKLKRRIFINDEKTISAISYLGAYDYLKRYGYAAHKPNGFDATGTPDPYPDKIWTCWLQGLDNAPEIISRCIGSISYHHKEDLIVLTDENIPQYIDIPDYIMQKRKTGIINNTFYSDILRFMIIQKYGGIWLDGTTYLLDYIPNYMRNADLFLYRNTTALVSVGVIAAKPRNEIITKTMDILLEYWKKESHLISYGVTALAFQLAVNSSPETIKAWTSTISVPNNKYLLLEKLFQPYDPDLLEIIRQQSVIQQLSWKFPEEEYEKEGTFYSVVVKQPLLPQT